MGATPEVRVVSLEGADYPQEHGQSLEYLYLLDGRQCFFTEANPRSVPLEQVALQVLNEIFFTDPDIGLLCQMRECGPPDFVFYYIKTPITNTRMRWARCVLYRVDLIYHNNIMWPGGVVKMPKYDPDIVTLFMAFLKKNQ